LKIKPWEIEYAFLYLLSVFITKVSFLKKKNKKIKILPFAPFSGRCLSLILNFLQNPTQAAKLKRTFNGQKVTNKLSMTFTFTFDNLKSCVIVTNHA
jgi:hypothetical protein